MHLWHMFCKSSKGGDCCSKQCSIALFDQFAKHIQLNLTISLSWDICRFIELRSFPCLWDIWLHHCSNECYNFKINIYTSQAFRKVVICWNRILERWNTSVWRLLKTVLKNELTVERLANSWTISYFWTKRWTIRIRSERLHSGRFEIRIWGFKWDDYPFQRL